MENIKNNELKTKLERELRGLHEELRLLGPIMRGSVTSMGRKNKQPYFSVKMRGKTKSIYLGNRRAEIAREYIINYRKLLEIVDKMTEVNMKILQNIKTK